MKVTHVYAYICLNKHPRTHKFLLSSQGREKRKEKREEKCSRQVQYPGIVLQAHNLIKSFETNSILQFVIQLIKWCERCINVDWNHPFYSCSMGVGSSFFCSSTLFGSASASFWLPESILSFFPLAFLVAAAASEI